MRRLVCGLALLTAACNGDVPESLDLEVAFDPEAVPGPPPGMTDEELEHTVTRRRQEMAERETCHLPRRRLAPTIEAGVTVDRIEAEVGPNVRDIRLTEHPDARDGVYHYDVWLGVNLWPPTERVECFVDPQKVRCDEPRRLRTDECARPR